MSARVLAALLLLAALPGAQDEGHPEPQPPAQQSEGWKSERVVIPRKGRSLVMDFLRANEDPATPTLVLYHRARASRGEYRPMLPRLHELGYNCLSVDLSSGGLCRDVKNLTLIASAQRNPPTFLDCIPDLEDSLSWAREHTKGKVIAWGSSYSAGLALHVASIHPELVDGVLAFSPTECFAPLGKSATWVQESAASVHQPVFITSARIEEPEWKAIFDALPEGAKTSFLPEGGGTSSSAALWPEHASHVEYWTAVEAFLAAHFPAPAKPKDG